MKKCIATFALVILSGCITPMLVKHEKDDPKVHTIGLDVGVWGADRIYVQDFEREAEVVCPEGYAIMERTRQPSTLAKDLIDPGPKTFYWVVRCK